MEGVGTGAGTGTEAEAGHIFCSLLAVDIAIAFDQV